MMPADMHRRRIALLSRYDGRAPRYTSYPTAVQFRRDVGPETYARWLSDLSPDQAVSLYIHVPFCARLCWYCGCNTRVVNRADTISDYVDHLVREIDLVTARLAAPLRVGHVHLGGGTPNMLSLVDIDRLFEALRRRFVFAPDAEIASELDPAQLTGDWARAAARNGLNRASLGVQELSPAVQAAVNRREPFDVVAGAVDHLRAAGVEAVNIDLMYGLPRQTTDDLLATLERVLTLRPRRVALFGYAHVPWMKAHQRLIDAHELPGAAVRT
jgi:oxygen-independent coproporphyrinogen-3 oxidase